MVAMETSSHVGSDMLYQIVAKIFESCSSSRKGFQHWLREQKNEQHKQRP